MDNLDWIKVRDELESVTFELGLYENKILLEIAKRLRFGQAEFGKFDEAKILDPKWAHEASQEIYDSLVYLGVRLLGLEAIDKERKQK